MKLLALLAVAVLSLAAMACRAESGDSPSTSTPIAEAPSPQATAVATAEAQPVSLEGAFSYNEMAQYLDTIAPMVAQYFEQQFSDIPDPNLVYIPSGRFARGACGDSDSWAYAYCGGDQTINVGQDLLWAFYRQAGDAAPAIALAHEWGHHVQLYSGVPYARTASQSVSFENQADCLSGAWAQYAGGQGWLETEDDLADVETLMRLIGSAETSRRDHGTTSERSQAFELAYAGGAAACNAYFPDEPVA